MDVKNELTMEFSGLRDGQSLAGQLCPKCGGGRTKERTLSVARDAGELVWICHRASCRFKGRDSVRGNADAPTNNDTRPKERKLSEAASLKDIPAKAREVLRDKYSLTEEHLKDAHLSWTNHLLSLPKYYPTEDGSGRLCIPVYNWKGVLDGHVLRSLTGATPKAITFVKSNSMAFYHKEGSTKTIVVEDAFSAIRLSRYTTAIALLGTNLNPSRIHDIFSTKAQEYYLWLDGDAFNLAVKYALKYKHLIKLHVRKLTKDIKDLDEIELVALLKDEGVIT